MAVLEPITEAFAAASNYDDLRTPLRAVAQLAGMQNYVVLRLRGGSFEHLVQLMHTAPASHAERFSQAEYWHASSTVREQLAGAAPSFFAGAGLAAPGDTPGFEHGFALTAGEPRGAYILMLARSSPVSEAEKFGVLSTTFPALHPLALALERLHLAACPLSPRQLDCLRHSLAGHKAAETGRALQLGTRTVEEYLVRARDHLQVPNSLAAAMRAVDQGWIKLHEVTALMAA